MTNLPLNGLTVLEFGRWLSGPSAGLRLADLGARVIKIETPQQADPSRSQYFLFHSINRNKEYVQADMQTEASRQQVHQLILSADVLLHNYPAEEMESRGLGYASLQAINPRLVYASISTWGGTPEPTADGQDLLVQALSGLAWTTGDDNDPPMPFGLPIADSLCGAQLVQGILAALIRRRHTGRGACVETSLLESALDFQFELLTTYYSSGQLPRRSTVNSGHTLLSAPYGIYSTADGHIAIAMMNIQQLAAAIHCDELAVFTQDEAFSRRDEMKQALALHLAGQSSAWWLERLHAEDLWAMEVLDWKSMTASEAYKVLNMEQQIQVDGKEFTTTRCPIRITTPPPDPLKGEGQHTEPARSAAIETNNNGAGNHMDPIDKAVRDSSPPLGGQGVPLLVLDFSQFLSGPSASLRLADLGAQVIKIERPGTGDICRQLYVSDTKIEGESTIFHAINRNKQSYAADLKNKQDLEKVKQLIAKADVMLHNFRPGVMERIGLDYTAVKKINPRIVYAEVTGYGSEGPWKDLPGQDLLLQSVSGLAWLSNNRDRPPTPMGVAVVDILAGTHIAQGILATLYRRGSTGEGALVQVSMLESILDFQSDLLTRFLNDGRLPSRSAVSNAHPWLPAPYGIYKTADGYIALGTGCIAQLGVQLDSPELQALTDEKDGFDKRDEIKQLIADRLEQQTTAFWLKQLPPSGVGCAEVMDYAGLATQPAYQALDMELKVKTSNGLQITTTRCPIRIDGAPFSSALGAPLLGEHNEAIEKQFGLKEKALSS
ncbi:MAG TPA: CoA transferase [Chitinophagaceae bacterium]